MAKPRSPYVEWIARRPHCLACKRPGVYHEDVGEYLLNPAHVKSRGAGGKDEGNVVPFCQACHNESHAKGWTYMMDRYKFSVWTEARKLLLEYKKERAIHGEDHSS